MKKRLGVNIDHVATLRNARGEKHPDPYTVALDVLKAGADSITVHLREDRRHINDMDLKILSSNKSIPINLEIASDPKMINIALKNKPSFICLVPEKRNEVTTEGGLNLKKNYKKISKIIQLFNKNKIKEFYLTGLVERLPSAILAGLFSVISFLSFFCGLILDVMKKIRFENKKMNYLLFKD